MSKLDIDNIRHSGDAKSIADRAKALLEIDAKVKNNELSPEAGIEAASAIFGNNSPLFKARCELLFSVISSHLAKSQEAEALESDFRLARSKKIAL